MTNSNEYLEWVYDCATNDEEIKEKYRDLFDYLRTIPFRYSNCCPLDENLLGYAKNLKYDFAYYHGIPYKDVENGEYDDSSVFVVLFALAEHCRDHTDQNVPISYWFSLFIYNLGLMGQTAPYKIDYEYVNERVNKFLDRQYEPDGYGGIFYVPECETDMRVTPIWYQFQTYLIYKYRKG